MAEVGSTLWELEEQLWLGGADVYRRYLADNSRMVFPGMVLTRAQTIDAIASGPRWASVNFTEQQVARLTPDTVALIYRASGSRAGEESPYSASVTSVYVKQDGE